MSITQIEIDNISNFKVLYAFRDKRTELYIGYDGYDTDFSRGISACIEQKNLISEINRSLITKSHLEVVYLLVNHVKQEWDKLGGFNNLDIVKLEVLIDGAVFSPADLLGLVSRVDSDEEEEES